MKYRDLINIRNHMGKWVKVTLLIMVSSLLYLIPLKIVEIIIDNTGRNITFILESGIVLLMIYVLSSYLGAYVDYYIDLFSFETSNWVRIRVFNHILNFNKEQFCELTKDGAFGSLIEDTKIVSESSIKPVCLLIKSGISFAGGLILVSSISPIITIVLLLIGLCASLINKHMSRKYQEHIHETRESSDRIWNLLNEISIHFLTIKLNRREDYYLEKAKEYSNHFYASEKKEDIHNKTMYAIDTIIFMGTIGALYIITSILVHFNQMSMGGLVAVMMYNSILIDPLLEFSQMIKEYTKTKVSINRINKYMMVNDIEIRERGKTKRIMTSLKLQDICYKDGNKLILDHVTLTIHIGEKVAIVGESGSGKTTLLYILCGLIKQSSGKIYVDDQICDGMEEYLDAFSVLLQQSSIYVSNLEDNLRLYTDDWDRETVSRCISMFELDEILGGGNDQEYMQTKLNHISGGEEKRVKLISVLVKKTDIICLDELSNSLDNNLCIKIMNYILKSFADKTLLAIDHRLKLVEKFDKIIVMKKGRIECIGTHDELLHTSDYYKKMYNSEENNNV